MGLFKKASVKITAVILVLVVAFTLSGCTQLVQQVMDALVYQGGSYEPYEGYNAIDEYFTTEGFSYTPVSDIDFGRPARSETPMGEPGSWTIFLYLCGADLESYAGLATDNLEELFAVTYPGDIKVVVQTGGADSWDNNYVNAGYAQRFVVQNGGMALVDEQPRQNMGEAETLEGFLRWGVETYPAEKMGVILWNHGGGSIDGVIFDEQYNNDSLTLIELEQAFNGVYEDMTDRFEFVGFDACLMATIETANVLVPHARYMVGSQEVEPGGGWDYSAFMHWLAQNPGASGAELGAVICDSYYEKCLTYGEGSYVTLSVIDLAQIDPLINVIEDMGESIYAASQDSSQFVGIVRDMASAQSYGGASAYEGFSNMVDLGDIGAKLEGSVGAAATALRWAVHDAVVYQVRGFAVSRATGLTIYYPLSINGLGELKFFNKVSVSESYVKYVDMVAYGNANGSLANYHYGYWDQNAAGYFNPASFSAFDAMVDAVYLGEGTTEWEPSAVAIEYAVEPYLNDQGVYTMTIAQESLDNVRRVYFALYLESGDNFIYIGTDSDIYVDYDTGVVEDNFRGVWPSLPDGQPLTLYILDEDEDYSRFSAPILLNGAATNLRFEYDWNRGEFVVSGTWDGIDDSGMSSREIRPLQDGDVITPVYQRYDTLYSADYESFYGDAYTVDYYFEVAEMTLEEGNYHYCFSIADIFGEYTETEFVVFYVDEAGGIFFDTPEGEQSNAGEEDGWAWDLFGWLFES